MVQSYKWWQHDVGHRNRMRLDKNLRLPAPLKQSSRDSFTSEHALRRRIFMRERLWYKILLFFFSNFNPSSSYARFISNGLPPFPSIQLTSPSLPDRSQRSVNARSASVWVLFSVPMRITLKPNCVHELYVSYSPWTDRFAAFNNAENTTCRFPLHVSPTKTLRLNATLYVQKKIFLINLDRYNIF